MACCTHCRTKLKRRGPDGRGDYPPSLSRRSTKKCGPQAESSFRTIDLRPSKLKMNMIDMASARLDKFTLNHLRTARREETKVAMLTCYDFTTARLMQEAGVPMLLVGDSA